MSQVEEEDSFVDVKWRDDLIWENLLPFLIWLEKEMTNNWDLEMEMLRE